MIFGKISIISFFNSDAALSFNLPIHLLFIILLLKMTCNFQMIAFQRIWWLYNNKRVVSLICYIAKRWCRSFNFCPCSNECHQPAEIPCKSIQYRDLIILMTQKKMFFVLLIFHNYCLPILIISAKFEFNRFLNNRN